jgi:hypothetical protein
MFNFMGVREIKESNDGFVKSKTDTTKEIELDEETGRFRVRDRETQDTMKQEFFVHPDSSKILITP